MNQLDPLALLSLLIALSAYVGGVRLAILGRVSAEHMTLNKAKLKKQLKLLAPADVALVLAAILLFLKIFWYDLFSTPAPACLDPVIVWAFFIGVVTLALHHAALWCKTFLA